jgi:hypothetical protein
MMFEPMLLPAALSTAIGAALVATASSRVASQRARSKASGGRLEPLLLDGDHSDWAQAPVHGTALLIRYQEPSGEVMEGIIQPKTIMGQRMPSRGVRPDTINAFCQTRQAMRTFVYTNIVWAADARSGDLIEDLYHYLGGAQPGGAPAPHYRTAGIAAEPRALKRHW